MGDGLTTIQDDAFMDCSALNSITLPHGLTYIADEAFFGCGNLEIIYNNSDLHLIPGSGEYGGIASNALLIVDKNGTRTYLDGYENIVYVETEEGFRFRFVDGTYYLVAYEGALSTVTIAVFVVGLFIPWHKGEAIVDDELPQRQCPQCGKNHDFDYPRCPHCDYDYLQK